MLKKIIIRIFVLGMLCLSFHSCQTEGTPFPSNAALLQSITNDAMGAVGGVQTAIAVGGPPVSAAHVVCYAVWGSWTGLSASGAFNGNGPQSQLWLNNYSQKVTLEKVNSEARNLYSKGNLQFTVIGELHNYMLDKWARSGSSVPFGNNSATKEFIRNNFEISPNSAQLPPSCNGPSYFQSNPVIADKLTEQGTKSCIYTLNSTQEVESIFVNLAQQNQNLAEGITVMKNIAVYAWNIYLTGNLQNLSNYLHIEVNKVNSNFYNLDYSNLAVATAMINIFTYSYYYWHYYLIES